MDTLHNATDRSRCVVGGSYALHQYLGDTHWEPNDIDIMCRANSHAEFQALLDRFKGSFAPAQVKVEKVKLLDDAAREQATREADGSGREERFHRSILATSTLAIDGVPRPVQLVGLDVAPQRTLLDHLNGLSDLPACVSYTVSGGARFFHVPERGLQALRTRRINRFAACSARIDMYKQRGFAFYD
jgi:hypothetical protein